MQVNYYDVDESSILRTSLSANHTRRLAPDSRHTFSLRKVLLHLGGSALLAAALVAQSALGVVAATNCGDTTSSNCVNQALPSAGAPVPSRYFSTTGKVVRGAFLNTFTRFGLASIGYPLSDERQEDGRTVQYFERVRMEYHPESAQAGFSVLMTRLGAEISRPSQPFASVAPFASTPGNVYFKQTGHSLSGAFLSYWKSGGGLELYGYPISEPVTQDGMKVQWFERARFEYHPELEKTGHPVQLTLLGKAAYEHVAPQAPVTPAGQQVQAQLVSSKVVKADPQPAAVSLSAMETYVFKSINEQRAAAGLGQVKLDASVTDVARSRSNDMATRNYFSHTTPEGNQFFSMLANHKIDYKYAGEILARNNYPDDQAAQVAMTSYLNSAPHKAIIMDGRYNLVGVGYSKAADGMQYYTVLFVQQ